MSLVVKRYAYVIALAAGAVGILIATGLYAFEASTVLLSMLGAIALGSAILGLSWTTRRPVIPSTPTPEQRVSSAVPETEPSEAFNEFDGSILTDDDPAYRRWRGLRVVAYEFLSRYTSADDEHAIRQLDDGTWTDDTTASRYLSKPPDSESSNRRTKNRSQPTGGDDVVRRTVRAIASTYTQRTTGVTERQRDDVASDPSEREHVDEAETRTTSRTPDRATSLARIETGHWWGVGTIALGMVGIGALAEVPGLLLAGTVGIGYAGFARSTSLPDPELEIERTVDPETPEPGETVTVETTLTNVGETTLLDVKCIDGVPGALQVVDGRCRVGTVIRPGQSVTMTYTVEARPGNHAFDPAVVIVGDASRSAERSVLVPESTTITCSPRLESTRSAIPLRLSPIRRAGHLTTTDGGSGTDFHSIREYQNGDPINRIDWNRHARTGELATIQFHTEQATRVLLVVDSRLEAYVGPSETAIHAVDRSVEAAGKIAASLLDDGDAVGLTAIGPTTRSRVEASESNEFIENTCWIPPASGPDHRLSIRKALTTHQQFSTVPAPDTRMWITQLGQLRRHLSGETQVILFTPLTDFGSVLIARRFASRGHPVTVISPDPTATRTATEELAWLCRTLRRDTLHRNGIPVLDWSYDERIDTLLERYANRGVVR
ncbi:DUF58 domain-containing protein [Halovivax gelatinilyticus]|uniref:DUF58 domain-containing protein n=1 Tax=Halovivax gelatinilyticus TaxID=2961597 RepID=UPI0020CA95B5|nr:DUF58 domain-containing protein [Halovivax gelatinilyticus]